MKNLSSELCPQNVIGVSPIFLRPCDARVATHSQISLFKTWTLVLRMIGSTVVTVRSSDEQLCVGVQE